MRCFTTTNPLCCAKCCVLHTTLALGSMFCIQEAGWSSGTPDPPRSTKYSGLLCDVFFTDVSPHTKIKVQILINLVIVVLIPVLMQVLIFLRIVHFGSLLGGAQTPPSFYGKLLLLLLDCVWSCCTMSNTVRESIMMMVVIVLMMMTMI